MKDLMNRFLILLGFVAVFSACEEEDLVVINEDFTTNVALSDNNIVLEEANEDLTALTVTWEEPVFGYDAAAEYNILFALGSNVETVNAGRPMVEAGMMKRDFTTGELNRILLNLEAEPDTEVALDVNVDIVLSKQVSKLSDPVGLVATAYSGVLDLTTPWGVVGDATPGGWGDPGPDTPFYKTDEDGVYVAYITMTEGFWKIRRDSNWDVNYGSNDGVNLQPGGDNIPVDPGTYKITFDENNLTYTIEPFTWGLVGSAMPNGWDGPDVPLTYDSCSNTWRTIVEVIDGEWKIRQNNSWDAPNVNYGSDNQDGTLQQGGANISVAAGKYEIIVDFNNSTYEIQETKVWGVVGSAYNDWGGLGPDFPFESDYCNEGIYKAYGVPLIVGEIKFRQENSWDAPNINYGDNGGDGILEEGGDNIKVEEEGTYDIILDFTNPSVPTYSLTKQ